MPGPPSRHIPGHGIAATKWLHKSNGVCLRHGHHLRNCGHLIFRHKAATNSIDRAHIGATLYGPWSVRAHQINPVPALPEVGPAFTRQAQTYERAIPDILARTTNIACELQQPPQDPLFRKLRRGNDVRHCGPFSCFCCLCSRDCGQLFTREGRGCLHRLERSTRRSFKQGSLGGVKRWQNRLGCGCDWGGT